MSFHYRAALFALSCASITLAQADLALINGRVWTGSKIDQAVAIRAGKIVAVGSTQSMPKAARVIDLQGKFAMPGFNDAHIHFSGGSQRLEEVDLNTACTLPEMQKRIREWAAAHPQSPWIRGGGWIYSCFPNSRLPTREDLDAATGDKPAFLSAYDGHTGWANTAALKLAGVGKGHKFEGFGEVVLDPATQLPTGCLKESAQNLVRKHLPQLTREEKLRSIETGLRYANSLGITSFQNASGNEEEFELYEELQKAGKLTMRVAIAMSAGQMTTDQATVDRWIAFSKTRSRPMLKMKAVKFMLDGVIESHTAAMLDLYADGTKSAGKLAWNEEEYRKAVARVDKAGLQIYTHAIGDRAVRVALDAYEAARTSNGARDRRSRIEHIETISERDVPRFASLNVMASMEPIHADPDTVEVWSKAVGNERVKRAFAWRTLERAGAKLVFSSDWPASISLDPIRGIHNAVNRQTIEGKPAGGWIPEQRVSLETALRGYTAAGAYAEFEEKTKGLLAPGYVADITVLDRDPFQIPAADLHTLRVKLTIVGGKIVYEP